MVFQHDGILIKHQAEEHLFDNWLFIFKDFVRWINSIQLSWDPLL